MKTLYAAALSRLGLSQAGAASLHRVRLDTVKSWATGRRSVAPGAWDELRALERRIVDASEAMRDAWDREGSPQIELDDSEADGLPLMAAADFLLGSTGPVHIGATTRAARRPN